MIAFFITVPVIAYFSMIAFHRMNLGVINYEGRYVPYSLGVVMIYSYSFLFAFPPQVYQSLTVTSFLFVFTIWLLGFIDDVFGKPYPKGLKGHVLYFYKEKILTTGLLKAGGTIAAALVYLWVNDVGSFLAFGMGFLLLTGFPHVMNLFDTRPLRVWKMTFCITILAMAFNPIPSFIFFLMIVTVFYIWYVLEGYRKAMLGDNGATVIGAILAVIAVNHLPLSVQYSLLLFVLVMILVAEKYSFSTIIEKSSFLRAIDQIGVMKK
jgi:UDP-N-acetylmuramyl pentapeptide phosphotransferase/UDP-N-acetylglucosamine-1-phosphate transferase